MNYYPIVCLQLFSSGVVTLDEASVRTKAKTRAKTYLPSKPDKYAIRFYAINCWKSLYLQNFFDNGAGHKGNQTCSDRYVQSFPKLRTLFHNSVDTVSTDNTIEGMEKTKQTWLWSLQMSHISLEHESPHKKRLVVTDNYYTRPTLSRVVRKMTDGEIRTIGTLRLSYAGKPNRANLELAISKLKDKERGSWMLVADHAFHPEYNEKKKKYDKENRNISKSQRTPFVPPVGEIIENAGFIVFMDKNPVIIHTNDLKYTMTTTFMYSNDQRTIDCVHGLVPLKRWEKKRSMFRSELKAPAIFVAYNVFMNGVDRMDQTRVVNPCRRKEIKLVMTIFTWAIDIACNNAFAIFKTLFPEKKMTMKKFKYEIVMSLIKENYDVCDNDNKSHVLLKNKNGKRRGCYLCKKGYDKESKSAYSCIICDKGFHVDCFSAYHHYDLFENNQRVKGILSKVRSPPFPRERKRRLVEITKLDELVLPCDKKTFNG